MGKPIDFIMISHSEMVNYEQYSKMPIERIELFRNLVQTRMVYHKEGFISHLDVVNKVIFNKCFFEADYQEKRNMLSVWNLPSFNGMLAMNQLMLDSDINCKMINNFDSEIDILIEYAHGMKTPLIGISSTFVLQWSEISRMTKIIKKHIPNAVIILGGAFVNDQVLQGKLETFDKYLRKYHIDYIIHSFNSEVDLRDLIKAIRTKSGYDKVNNLSYLNSNDEHVLTEKKWNEPVIYVPTDAWTRLYEPYMGSTLQLRTVSGCPFTCAFCTYPTTAGGFFTSDVEKFREQLEAIKALGTVKNIILIDDTPNVPLARFRELVEVLKDFNFRWYSFLRVQYMDEELAKNMAISGCDAVYLGIESANDEVLKNMNKKSRVADYRKGIELLRKYGITSFAAFVLGFPGETQETVASNIKFIEDSGIEYYSLKEFYYMSTAPIHKDREKYGLEGMGNRWQHNTMSSAEASDHKLRIFETIKTVPCIDSDSGLWLLAYLRGEGFSWKEIRETQVLINDMMILDNQNKFVGPEKDALLKKLETLLASTEYYRSKKQLETVS